MKYFTVEEARRVMSCTTADLLIVRDENPNREAAAALLGRVSAGGNESIIAALYGFALGRATGIREERARRKQKEGRQDEQ